jgi:hypothetical protein
MQTDITTTSTSETQMTDDLLSTLKALEVALHQPGLRRDANFAAALIHDDFMEFGRSGTIWSRAGILDLLASADTSSPTRTWSQDYRIHQHEENLALLTYKSAQVDGNKQLTRHTLRSSLWKKTPAGWQMVFHQGTPTEAFEAAAINESAR